VPNVINLTMPEQAAPVVNITQAPIQVDGPTVNVTPAAVNVAAPVVNVSPPAVTVESPTVNVSAPVVNVAAPLAPQVTVPVNVTVDKTSGNKSGTLTKMADGKYAMTVKETTPN
jgi:phage gp45-like